jgi:hypothetical protein
VKNWITLNEPWIISIHVRYLRDQTSCLRRDCLNIRGVTQRIQLTHL